MKEFIGTCVENPFDRIELLVEVVENARGITKHTFLRNCIIDREIRYLFNKYPYDYEFFKYRNIYFFTWSAIEHFYQ